MSRFQAMTNAVLDKQLDELREEMGLASSQKAELLRELAGMASWIFAQARAGRTVEARGGSDVEVFRHPALDMARKASSRVVLDDEEARQLLSILDRPEGLSPALRETLARLADPDRTAPELEWREA